MDMLVLGCSERLEPEVVDDQQVDLLARCSGAGRKGVGGLGGLELAKRIFGGRGNILSLPGRLSRGVFFVVTHRPIEDFPLSLETTQQSFYLEADSEGNLLDVRHYLEQVAGRL